MPFLPRGQLPIVSYLFAPFVRYRIGTSHPLPHLSPVPVPTGTILVPVPVGTILIPIGTVPVPVHVGTVPVPVPAGTVPIPYTATSFFPGTTSFTIVWFAILVQSVASDASIARLICGSDTRRCVGGSPSLIFWNNTPTGCTSPTGLATVSASYGTKCAEDNFGGVNFTLVLFHCARSPPC